MKKLIVILLLSAMSCSQDDPEPNGCLNAVSPLNKSVKLTCVTKSQFEVAVKNDGKVGANLIHPDWDYYRNHYWELCDDCR